VPPRLWNVATRRQIRAAMPTAAKEISQVAFSPDGKTLATVYEFSVALWNVATHRQAGKPIGAHRRTDHRSTRRRSPALASAFAATALTAGMPAHQARKY